MIEAQDIERINFHHKGKEKFCVEVNQVTGTLNFGSMVKKEIL